MRTCAYSLVSEGNYWVCFLKILLMYPKLLIRIIAVAYAHNFEQRFNALSLPLCSKEVGISKFYR